MKATTEQIKTTLTNLAFLNKSLLEGVTDTRLLSVSYQEVNFKESLDYFQYYRELLLDFIEKNPNLFEMVSSYANRTAIIATLNKLLQLGHQFKPSIANIPQGQQISSQIIAQITVMQQLLSTLNIESYSKHAPNYYKKLSDINYLTRRYKELEKKLEDIDDLHSEINDIYEFSQGVKTNLESTEKNASDITNQISAILKDIETRYESIKNINKNSIEFNTSSKQNAESINLFFSEIEKFRASMTDGLKIIQDNIKNFETLNSQNLEENEKAFKESIVINTGRTETIVSQNENLQKTILEILGKAVGTQLYKSFDEKANSLKKVSWGWLSLLIISLIGLTIIGYDVVAELITTKAPLTTSFYLRVTVLFPVIYAVYFFATLYKTTNKIKEEYDFKSAVSVSLHHFKDIIENSKDNPETQTFLKESIHNIFSSPTDKVFGHAKVDKDINDRVENTVEKIVSLANSIISKK